MDQTIFTILCLNPGSTSTKFGLFENSRLLMEHTVRHSDEELNACSNMEDQKHMRMGYLIKFLEENNIALSRLDAVVGRGGLLKPMPSGTFAVNDRMLEDLSTGYASSHASALGGIIAAELGRKHNIPAFIVDPPVVDEFNPVARLSGHPTIERSSVFHALNAKSVAKTLAKQQGVSYQNARFIVAHMGGGVTVSAHCCGKVIDVSNAVNGEGPFTPERSGSLPLKPLIEMCYSGTYTKQQMMRLVMGEGGVQAYLGTQDMRKAEEIAEHDEQTALVLDAMAYQTAKEIGAMAAVLEGRVDAIILTGGLAHSKRITEAVKLRINSLAPIFIFPGEEELLALAQGGLRVLQGEEAVGQYL